SGSSPDNVKASVWQTPVWVILTRTSPLRGGSTSISTISSGLPASKATAARGIKCFSLRHGLRSDYHGRGAGAGGALWILHGRIIGTGGGYCKESPFWRRLIRARSLTVRARAKRS